MNTNEKQQLLRSICGPHAKTHFLAKLINDNTSDNIVVQLSNLLNKHYANFTNKLNFEMKELPEFIVPDLYDSCCDSDDDLWNDEIYEENGKKFVDELKFLMFCAFYCIMPQIMVTILTISDNIQIATKLHKLKKGIKLDASDIKERNEIKFPLRYFNKYDRIMDEINCDILHNDTLGKIERRYEIQWKLNELEGINGSNCALPGIKIEEFYFNFRGSFNAFCSFCPDLHCRGSNYEIFSYDSNGKRRDAAKLNTDAIFLPFEFTMPSCELSSKVFECKSAVTYYKIIQVYKTGKFNKHCRTKYSHKNEMNVQAIQDLIKIFEPTFYKSRNNLLKPTLSRNLNSNNQEESQVTNNNNKVKAKVVTTTTKAKNNSNTKWSILDTECCI